MYTVVEALRRTQEHADKLGSDMLTIPVFLPLFKTEVYDFIGARAAENEKTQQITDDIVKLVVPVKRPFTDDLDDPRIKLASKPADYIARVSTNVAYTDGTRARQPQHLRHGEVVNAQINPFKKATKDYPIITQYEDYFQVQTNIPSINTVQPDHLFLMYVREPQINQGTNDVICPDLSTMVLDLIFQRVANKFMANRADARIQATIPLTEAYRKR